MALIVYLVWFALLFAFIEAVSQDGIANTKGKIFSLAFFPEYKDLSTSDFRNRLYLASSSNGNCTVSYLNNNGNTTTHIALVANEIVEKAFPETTQMRNIGTGREAKAFHVQCNVDIALYGFNKIHYQGDIAEPFIVLPEDMLSTKYLVASVDKTAFIGVVPTKPNTSVSIHLKSTCSYQFGAHNYGSGDVLNVTLTSAYDVLRLGGTTDSKADTCDLGGTELQSSDPVAVFSGALYYRGSGNSWDNGHLVHQVPPLAAFTRTVIVPRPTEEVSAKMVVRTIASQNATVLNITYESSHGVVQSRSHHLDKGEVLNNYPDENSNVIIQSSAPVMVIQNILYLLDGGSSMFVPGVDQYERSFLVKGFYMDGTSKATVVNIVTESASTGDVRVNGVYPRNITWTSLATLPYSIGSLTIEKHTTYNITGTSPLMVRLDDTNKMESYSYVSGYQVTRPKANLKDAVSLKCLPAGWIVTLDLNKAILQPTAVPDVYLTNDNCTGTLNGHILVFSMSYDDCHTKTSVSNGTLSYTNTLLYTPRLAEHLVTDIKWVHDIKCSMPVNVTDSVHIYPDYHKPHHTGTSGVIEGKAIHVSLYKDASFMDPIPDSVIKAEIGKPVYVQVASSGSQNTVMVVRSCDAHLEDDKHVSYTLIDNGCTDSSRTEILVSRNQVTRFKFVMFDLPSDQDGIYVTCHVTFCDPMDFSARCQQRCHTDPHVGIVG